MKYIIALDQGTSSSRAVLLDEEARILGIAQEELTQHYPKAGWVEHDPEEIWQTQLRTLKQVLEDCRVEPKDVLGIGITNQRETAIVWDRVSGKPIYKAIVWQDRRTADYCKSLKEEGYSDTVRERTGLVLDSYFSATKVAWLLDNIPGARAMAESGDLCFGTVDSWLLWKLTSGRVHATDYTNASRTLLFNIHTLSWDEELLDLFNIPKSILLPKVFPSMHKFGTSIGEGIDGIPLLGIGGDQQAALFGQACFEPGMAKNTYGTGCFLLLNTGEKAVESKHGLLTTVTCDAEQGRGVYALEGSIFIAGAAIQWLRDGLQIIKKAGESEALAKKAKGDDEVYVVPAFAGLGAPYWDMYARGAIFGLTRDTGKEHLAKATLQSLAYQTKDVVIAMEQDSGIDMQALRVDGGACANSYLMQFQADILGITVERPEVIESTALGAAYLAGIKAGVWTKQIIQEKKASLQNFSPEFEQAEIDRRYSRWQEAVKRSMGWVES